MTKQQILEVLNINLKNHPDYIEGMSFDDLSINNGVTEYRAHFFFDQDNRPTENTHTAQRVYNEIVKNCEKSGLPV